LAITRATSAVPRLEPTIETTAYFVNRRGDDGVGGADPAGGSGLVGLRDRVAARDGTLEVHSALGDGTSVRVRLPAS
jgi:glucose-6-phosphate-specific signal transduction histidine kinase